MPYLLNKWGSAYNIWIVVHFTQYQHFGVLFLGLETIFLDPTYVNVQAQYPQRQCQLWNSAALYTLVLYTSLLMWYWKWIQTTHLGRHLWPSATLEYQNFPWTKPMLLWPVYRCSGIPVSCATAMFNPNAVPRYCHWRTPRLPLPPPWTASFSNTLHLKLRYVRYHFPTELCESTEVCHTLTL